MLIGRLEALRRYPVKSLSGEALDEVEVDSSGIPGDRSRALFALGGAREGKPYRGKENDHLHLLRDAEQARTLAAERGVGIELRSGEHFFDAAPISILVDTWLEDLSAHVGYLVEWERFRPNFFVGAAGTPAPSELQLVGKELRLGSVRLCVRSPIERCVTINYHPRGEAEDPRILRYLAQQRNASMGIYCDVVEAGVARSGDQLVEL